MMTPSQRILVVVNIIGSLVEGLIFLRIILKFFGAATVAPFVSWVYDTSEPLLGPFVGIFPSPKLTGGFVIEFSAVFALVVYAFIGYLVVELIESLAQQHHHKTKN